MSISTEDNPTADVYRTVIYRVTDMTYVHDGREKRMTRNVFPDRSAIEIQFVIPRRPNNRSVLDSLGALNASSGTAGKGHGLCGGGREKTFELRAPL